MVDAGAGVSTLGLSLQHWHNLKVGGRWYDRDNKMFVRCAVIDNQTLTHRRLRVLSVDEVDDNLQVTDGCGKGGEGFLLV